MRDLEKEVHEIAATAKCSPAVYEVDIGWDKGIVLRKTGRLTVHHDSPIAKRVELYISETLNLTTMKHQIVPYGRVADDVRYSICNSICDWLRRFQESKNNKLTTLYRWYQTHLTHGNLSRNETFENDMFHMSKWLLSLEGKWVKGEANTKSAISVLEALRQRYEAQGMKI